MDNDEIDGNKSMIVKTIKDNDNNSTVLIIPEFARKLQIENSKVSISIRDGFTDGKHLLASNVKLFLKN